MECHCHRGRTAGVWLGISLVQTLWRRPLSTLPSTDPVLLLAKPKRKKRAKYASLSPTFCFGPVAVETLGALGDGADELMHDLGRRISEVTGERRATEFLLQRLSVAIQRGNAASVLGTVDSTTITQNYDIVY